MSEKAVTSRCLRGSTYRYTILFTEFSQRICLPYEAILSQNEKDDADKTPIHACLTVRTAKKQSDLSSDEDSRVKSLAQNVV